MRTKKRAVSGSMKVCLRQCAGSAILIYSLIDYLSMFDELPRGVVERPIREEQVRTRLLHVARTVTFNVGCCHMSPIMTPSMRQY